MKEPSPTVHTNEDPTAKSRKKDHIDLAFASKVDKQDIDNRFYYEPILSGHPTTDTISKRSFLGKTFNMPVWVSSMTGGTELAGAINKNLAMACAEFGMGMGLGSCRALLYSDEVLTDFDVRRYMEDQPLYANLGIAQVEQLITDGEVHKINILIQKLQADGLIVHINPLQEWLQPEGDRYYIAPIDTIKRLLDALDTKIIVKEVGQGMGRESLKALFQLPLEAIDFAANGGTNFAKLELLRSEDQKRNIYENLANIGHSASEMVDMTNDIVDGLKDNVACRQIIVSGGISNFLDGYYHISKLKLPAIYGQASAFLKYAKGDYETLQTYIETQREGLKLAYAFLKAK